MLGACTGGVLPVVVPVELPTAAGVKSGVGSTDRSVGRRVSVSTGVAATITLLAWDGSACVAAALEGPVTIVAREGGGGGDAEAC